LTLLFLGRRGGRPIPVEKKKKKGLNLASRRDKKRRKREGFLSKCGRDGCVVRREKWGDGKKGFSTRGRENR